VTANEYLSAAITFDRSSDVPSNLSVRSAQPGRVPGPSRRHRGGAAGGRAGRRGGRYAPATATA
jgi:hypothetical protein